MKYIYYLINLSVISCLIFFSGCEKESNTHFPIESNSSIPEQVTNIQVENQHGKATIFYEVPNDPNLLYVKAVYTMTNGQQVEKNASYYTDSLVVNGFADTLSHQVKLYSVSRSGATSEPISVKIKPLKSPIYGVFQSLQIKNNFSGYDIIALNPSGADVRIVVTKKNKFEEFEIDNDQSVFTSLDSIFVKRRGMDISTYHFGFSVSDHWGNTTDTVYKTIEPLFEQELDQSKFRPFPLPGDAPMNENVIGMNGAWDDRFGWPNVSFTPKEANALGPNIITFDLGVKAKISRIVIYPYPEAGPKYYFFTTMKRFEIWGSVDPSPDGSLDDSWFPLGSYKVIKPSGLPYGTENAEDRETAAAGFSWEADPNAPKVQYIRIKCLENFGGGYQQSINELNVFGQVD